MSDKYKFKPHDESFPERFLQEKARLSADISVLAIEHVGSTAVPGLGGKGIIDIAIAANRAEIPAISKQLESLGYIFREQWSTSERAYFNREGFHLHLTFPTSSEWKNFLRFRDYLRRFPKEAERYVSLKKGKNAEYRASKKPFIEEVLAKPKIYFIIGASGAGKTTALELLKEHEVFHFDSIGVPSFDEMKEQFGSLEEWQRIKTIEWVEKLASKSGTLILDAQTRPSFIEEACSKCTIDYGVILLDCNDEERKRRLIARGHPELADANMMSWAAYLRRECVSRHLIILDTSSLSSQAVIEQLHKILL